MSIGSTLIPSHLQNTPAATAPHRDSPAKTLKAAADFEALLLAEMLKSARESSGGGWSGTGGDDDDANSTLVELGEQQFAQALASGGGLGIAKMVVAGLMNHANR